MRAVGPVAVQAIRAAASAIRAVTPAGAALPIATRPAPAATHAVGRDDRNTAELLGSDTVGRPPAHGSILDVLTAALALVSREVDRLLNRRSTSGAILHRVGHRGRQTGCGGEQYGRLQRRQRLGTGHTANMAVTAGSSNLTGWTVEFDTRRRSPTSGTARSPATPERTT